MFTLGHLSDWHATSLVGAQPAAFLNKRVFGWLSWNARRSRIYRPAVLEAAFADLQRMAPDHVAVTGDLTNVALEQEFVTAAGLLKRLGGPDWVSVIPGNHDAYIPVPSEHSWNHWADYIRSDEADPTSSISLDAFPTVRIRGEVALVGVCSAVPTPVFMASGRVGPDQLARLEARLAELREQLYCRVVLVHHPVTAHGLSRRRQLMDAAELRAVLERAGAELVLHGHRHRTFVGAIPGPEGEIPVVGVRSSSHVADNEHKRAQYHLYHIERRDAGLGYRLRLTTRGYDPDTRRFLPEGERNL